MLGLQVLVTLVLILLVLILLVLGLLVPGLLVLILLVLELLVPKLLVLFTVKSLAMHPLSPSIQPSKHPSLHLYTAVSVPRLLEKNTEKSKVFSDLEVNF